MNGSADTITTGALALQRDAAEHDVQPVNARQLEVIVRQHLPHVYRVLRQLGVPSCDADDATQQVFWTLSRRLADVRDGCERAFLSTTAVRIASRWRRTHRRRCEDDDSAPISQAAATLPSPEHQLERAEAERTLFRVLDAIPEKLREVFVLFEIEQLTLREISESLQLPQGTISSRLRLARDRFREAVRELQSSDAHRRER